mgnify:CR=1 FL=1
MSVAVTLPVSLDDKYILESGRVYLTGTQALVRLLLAQKALDERNGLKTAGFVSGYRGSPLGMVDQQLWKAKKFLDAAHIEFLPAIPANLPRKEFQRRLEEAIETATSRLVAEGRRDLGQYK